ncbi:hypothetical protein ACQ4PT_025609 [Festuca glaucescens]
MATDSGNKVSGKIICEEGHTISVLFMLLIWPNFDKPLLGIIYELFMKHSARTPIVYQILIRISRIMLNIVCPYSHSLKNGSGVNLGVEMPNATKARAKTIDLCNNPMTKEPKLQGAKRIVPEWVDFDSEARQFTTRILGENAEIAESTSPPSDAAKPDHKDLSQDVKDVL